MNELWFIKAGHDSVTLDKVTIEKESDQMFFLEKDNPSHLTRCLKSRVDGPFSDNYDGKFYSSREGALKTCAARFVKEQKRIEYIIDSLRKLAKEK